MKRHVYRCEQRSEEWYELRRGIVTASVVGNLITPSRMKPAENDTSRGIVATLAAERISGHVESTYTNADMWRGIESEPFARDKYAETIGQPVEEVGFMILEDGWRLGYSPDGLVGRDGLLEVKAPRGKTHIQTVLSGEIPVHHVAQIQAGLLVSGRQWCDYVSYCGGLPMWVKRMYPIPRWQEAIVETVRRTEASVQQMVSEFHANTEGMPTTERISLEVF